MEQHDQEINQEETEKKRDPLELRDDPAPERKGLSPNVKKEIREWVVTLAVALIAVFLIRNFLFSVIRVEGESMLNTLHDNDKVIVSVIDKLIRGAQRGEVVICRYPNRSEQFVKRVIGIGGDTIEVRDGVTYVNEELQDEPFVAYPARGNFGPYVVPEGMYFVMGDNRANSNDSRAPSVGPITGDMIVGVARVIVWPLSDIGLVNG